MTGPEMSDMDALVDEEDAEQRMGEPGPSPHGKPLSVMMVRGRP